MCFCHRDLPYKQPYPSSKSTLQREAMISLGGILILVFLQLLKNRQTRKSSNSAADSTATPAVHQTSESATVNMRSDEDVCSSSVSLEIENSSLRASVKLTAEPSGSKELSSNHGDERLDPDPPNLEAINDPVIMPNLAGTTYVAEEGSDAHAGGVPNRVNITGFDDEGGAIEDLNLSETTFYGKKRLSSGDTNAENLKVQTRIRDDEDQTLIIGEDVDELQKAFALDMGTLSAVAQGKGGAQDEVSRTLPTQRDGLGSGVQDYVAAVSSQLDSDDPTTGLMNVCPNAEIAVMVFEQFLSSSPLTLVDFLRALADASRLCFEETEDVAQIDKSLSFISKAIDLFPAHGDGDVGTLVSLYQVEGMNFYTRFECLGAVSDIESAIRSWTRASDFTDNDHTSKPSLLSNLGVALRTRFECLERLVDIDNAICIQRQAVDFAPGDHADKLGLLNNLGISLYTRGQCLGKLADIDNAISTQQLAVNLTPESHPDKPSFLNNLGASLHTRFEWLGELADLHNAVSTQREAVNLTPEGYTDKPSWLSNLGGSLHTRFERLGELVDIDDSISALQQAVDLTPDIHPDKPSMLTNLGGSLLTRFERLKEPADIDNAISVQRRAVNLTPEGHKDKPSRLSNLGASLEIRFRRLGELVDIDNAVRTLQQAVDLTPEGHEDKPSWLNNLGISLEARYESSRELVEIDNAISSKRQAVDLTPENHVNKPALLNNLGNSLRTRFGFLGELVDVDNAISVQRKAVDLTPDSHASRSSRLTCLGKSLYARYKRLDSSDDLDSAISSFSAAMMSVFGAAIDRYRAARRCAIFLHPTLPPYQKIIELIPQLVWLGRTVQQRYKDLESLGDAAMEAASAACVMGDHELALEWLEQGRTIVWGQILHLRSPMDELRENHSILAEELNSIAAQLEIAGTSDAKTIATSKSSLEQPAQAHRRLAERWEALLEQVRKLPNFTNFLQPKPASLLKAVSRQGTVVVVNVSQYQTDALILRSGSSTVGHVQLTNATLDKLSAARRSLFKSLHTSGVRMRNAERKSTPGRTVTSTVLVKILEMLWNDVANPILDYLGYTVPPVGDLPRITWCLTGPLTSLPLHAAGIYYDSGNESQLFSYVVSSYTPSLTALLETMDRAPTSTPHVLAVTQAATPNLSRLPGTTAEVDEVAKQMSTHDRKFTRMDGEDATVSDISEQMDRHDWVHFSCHGKQDALEPTKSAFYLHDGTLELAEIMKKPLKHAELAYLSACQTASGDTALPDEAVHLAAGMFIAGYRSVVATLWSIKDDEAPLVARVFYDCLLSNPEGGAARALHEAFGELRKQVGDKNFLSWVPYIHIGH